MPKLIKNPAYTYGKELEYEPGFEGYTVPESVSQHAILSGALKGLQQLISAVSSGRLDMIEALKNTVNYLNQNYALGLKFDSLTDLPQLQSQVKQVQQIVNSGSTGGNPPTDYTKYILILGGLAVVVILLLFLLK